VVLVDYVPPTHRLVCDAGDRLGYNVDDLKRHPFFRGTDWEHIRDRPSAVPIVVKHMADTSNFDDFEELDDQKRSKSIAKCAAQNTILCIYNVYTINR